MDAPLAPSLTDRLRKFIVQEGFDHNDRLPAERDLCQRFGVKRGELRKALADMESDGLIWRHVGRGTFIGARPVLNLADVVYLGEMASPAQVIVARLAIEPELARLAALHGSRADFEGMLRWSKRCRTATDWRSYEAADNNLHHTVAKATHNKLLVYLFDTLNVVRRSTVWGQRRLSIVPPRDHFAFDQHDAITDAIVARDSALAAAHMRDHLLAVRERVLPAMSG